MKAVAIVLSCVYVLLLTVATSAATFDDDPPIDDVVVATTPVHPPGGDDGDLRRERDRARKLERQLQGVRRDLRQQKRQLVYWRRRARGLHRQLVTRSSTSEAINLACQVYGNCATLWRKARCESQLYSGAYNASSGASGLFQFLGSTWRSTPFGGFSVFSSYANALAAGWMHTVGRGGEWVCR